MLFPLAFTLIFAVTFAGFVFGVVEQYRHDTSDEWIFAVECAVVLVLLGGIFRLQRQALADHTQEPLREKA